MSATLSLVDWSAPAAAREKERPGWETEPFTNQGTECGDRFGFQMRQVVTPSCWCLLPAQSELPRGTLAMLELNCQRVIMVVITGGCAGDHDRAAGGVAG